MWQFQPKPGHLQSPSGLSVIYEITSSVLSHKFVCKSGRRWQEFHRRVLFKKRVGGGGGGVWYNGGGGPPLCGGGGGNPPRAAFLSGGGDTAPPRPQQKGAPGRRGP